MTIKDIAEAMAALRPNAEYTINDTVISFVDSNIPPLTWEEIINYIETTQE